MSQAASQSVLGFTGGQVTVGQSACIGLTGGAGQINLSLQYGTGQTIWISGSSSGASIGMVWGVTVAPIQYFPDYRGSVFFTAGGSTATINWWKTLSTDQGGVSN